MKQTIQELWSGNITPGVNCGVGISEIENLAMLIERHRQTLEQELGQPQKTVFEKYADCGEEYMCLLSRQAFSDGFCLACKLMTEALSETIS